MTDDFWSDRFHWCAQAAGFLAAESHLHDSAYVCELAYRMFEERIFRSGNENESKSPQGATEYNKELESVRRCFLLQEELSMGEFLLGVLTSLVASGLFEVVKFLLQNRKGGALLFPGMANLLAA